MAVRLLERVLPRHLQIIHEINRRLLAEVGRRFPGDEARVQRMSLIAEGPRRTCAWRNLAMAGSHSVNGVAAHSQRAREAHARARLPQLWPERFNNKTNGVTPRRWLLHANPALAALITERSATAGLPTSTRLQELESFADDAASQDAFLAVKRANKVRAGASCSVRPPASPSTLTRCSTSRSSASTNTSGSC